MRDKRGDKQKIEKKRQRENKRQKIRQKAREETKDEKNFPQKLSSLSALRQMRGANGGKQKN